MTLPAASASILARAMEVAKRKRLPARHAASTRSGGDLRRLWLRRWNLLRPRIHMRDHGLVERLGKFRRAGFQTGCGRNLLFGHLLRYRQILSVISADSVLHHSLLRFTENQQHLVRRRLAQN